MRNKRKHFLLKPLAVFIGISLSASALANTTGQPATPQEALFPGPFSKVPLHLQEMVISSGSNVKPNVILQIDNSGSMAWSIDNRSLPDGDPNSRIEITRRALLKLLRNPAYRNTVNWNMNTLYDLKKGTGEESGRIWLNHARKFLAGGPFERTPEELESLISDRRVLYPVGVTPTSERYLDSIYLLQRALERPGVQSCQQSFVVIFSDGAQNSASYVPFEREHIYPYSSEENFGFRLQYNSRPTTDGQPTLFFAQKDRDKRYVYRHNNPFAFRVQGYTDPQHERDNFLRYDGYDPTKKGWNWSGHGASLANVIGNSGSLYFAVNRSNFLKYFAESVYQTDWNPNVAGKQNIQTFTIAFGIDRNKEPKAFDYLSGGSVSDEKFGLKGQVLNARSEAELDKAFERIFGTIAKASKFEPPASYSSISPAVTSEDLTRKVPNMAAAVHLDLASGSSELRFYQAQGDDKKFTVNTSTYTKPSFNNRRFIINVNGVNTWLERLRSDNQYFAIPDTGSNRSEWSHSLTPWLMRDSDGDTSLNQPGNALRYRVRRSDVSPDTRSMGDVIDSPVAAYGPVEYGRQKYLITAANDGMVYLFQSQNDPNHPYDLKLNYIPADMQRESATDTLATHFKHIVHPEYVSDPIAHPHRYMINGGIMVRKMDSNGPQPIFMAGAMGQGGRGVYALNVGGPHRHTGAPIGIDAGHESWTSSVPLFETPKGADNVMGYTTSTPQIGRLAFKRTVNTGTGDMTTDYSDVRYGVFVGSGVRAPGKYNASSGRDETESALYIYNAMENVNVGLQNNGSAGDPNLNTMKAGELIKKLPVPANLGFGGLAQPAIIDTNLDGVIDVVYAGDYSGGLYRFDLRGTPDQWTVHKIFQTADRQPITAAPAVLRQDQNTYVVIFGTGSDLFQADLTNRDPQSVYGIYDNLTESNPQPKQVSQLVEQTITKSTFSLNGSTVNTRILSDNPIGNEPKGWYFRLPDPGERVVVKPGMLLKTALIVTRQYREETTGKPQNAGVCSVAETQRTRSSGKSWIMQVKGDNGGNIPGKDGDDVYAYADFLKQRDPSAPKKRADMIPSGVENNSLYSFTLFAGNGGANQIGGYGNSTTAHGDVTNSPAEDSKLKAPPPRDLLCYDRDDNKLLGGLSGTGLNAESTEVHAKICTNAGIRRLSWREIF